MIEIAPGLNQIPLAPRPSVHAYLMGDVLVDAGMRWSARRLLSALKGRSLSAHVLTHAHPDHQGASHAVCEALDLPLLCHPLERAAAESGKVTSGYPNPRGLVARLQDRIAGPGHPVARTLEEGDGIGGFTVVHAPGHTRGQIAFWRASDRILVAGDAALGMNLVTTAPGLDLPLRMATTDMDEARRSIRKLAALDPARVVFGHGPAADGAAFRRFAETV